MKLKELLRVLVASEMEDISVYSVEAELFGADPACGEKILRLFERLAAECHGNAAMTGLALIKS